MTSNIAQYTIGSCVMSNKNKSRLTDDATFEKTDISRSGP
jgi:hypothetical protein